MVIIIIHYFNINDIMLLLFILSIITYYHIKINYLSLLFQYHYIITKFYLKFYHNPEVINSLIFNLK